MSTTNSMEEFNQAYSTVLVKSWTDEEFSTLLDNDPVEALRSCGLELPSGASVNVWRHIAEDAPAPSEDAAFELWRLGEQTGTYMMSVPPIDEISSKELDEADLEKIAAGWSVSCCSCCPCCCCV